MESLLDTVGIHQLWHVVPQRPHLLPPHYLLPRVPAASVSPLKLDWELVSVPTCLFIYSQYAQSNSHPAIPVKGSRASQTAQTFTMCIVSIMYTQFYSYLKKPLTISYPLSRRDCSKSQVLSPLAIPHLAPNPTEQKRRTVSPYSALSFKLM